MHIRHSKPLVYSKERRYHTAWSDGSALLLFGGKGSVETVEVVNSGECPRPILCSLVTVAVIADWNNNIFLELVRCIVS